MEPKFSDKADPKVVARILRQHSIEVWEGCAVCQYVTADHVPGEQLVPLTSFKTYQDLRDWLGY